MLQTARLRKRTFYPGYKYISIVDLLSLSSQRHSLWSKLSQFPSFVLVLEKETRSIQKVLSLAKMRCFVNSSLVFGIASLAASVAAGTNSTIPMQVRLAYAGPTGMTVSWNTFSKLSNPTVHYGLSSQSLNLTASSNVSVTYLTSTTFNNHVEITGLQPSTKYFYQPQDSNVTTPYSFTTSRAAGDGASFSVAVVVDLGLIGPDGLSTSVGEGAANPLSPGEQNTIQSLTQSMGTFDHLFHGNLPGTCSRGML